MERWHSKTLGQQVLEVLEKAIEMARKSTEILIEKASETAQVTKLRLEILRLEHQVARKFTKLGSLVYEKRVHQGQKNLFSDPELIALIEDVERLDQDLSHVQALLEKEHVRV